MATSAKKNAKAKQETTSTINIKKLIGLIDQLEEQRWSHMFEQLKAYL